MNSNRKNGRHSNPLISREQSRCVHYPGFGSFPFLSNPVLFSISPFSHKKGDSAAPSSLAFSPHLCFLHSIQTQYIHSV